MHLNTNIVLIVLFVSTHEKKEAYTLWNVDGMGSRKAIYWLQYLEKEYVKTRHYGKSPYMILLLHTSLIQGVLLQTLAYELPPNI
jgi:hypothetical protein